MRLGEQLQLAQTLLSRHVNPLQLCHSVQASVEGRGGGGGELEREGVGGEVRGEGRGVERRRGGGGWRGDGEWGKRRGSGGEERV